MGRFSKCAFVAVVALLCASAQQLRADTVDQFTYTVITGAGNTVFAWQLPPSPSGPTLSPIAGSQFTLPTDFTENGNPISGFITFFNGDPFVGGGLQILDGSAGPLADGLGPQVYMGTESAPTFVPGTYDLVDDFVDPFNFSPATLTITEVQVTPAPEPSSGLLLGSGLFVLAIGFAIKKLFT